MTTLAATPGFATTLAIPAITDDPRREMRTGALVAGVFFFGFLGWSAIARLDAAAYAPGTVKVSGDRQTIQSLEGGIVSKVDVHEGQMVRAGDLLIEFATAEAIAQERSLATRVIGLRAQIARLEAERQHLAAPVAPAEFAVLAGADRVEAMRAMAAERVAFDAEYRTEAAQRRLLAGQVAQIDHQIAGRAAELDANATQQSLNREELSGIQQLAAKGYAPKTRVLALQRTAAGLSGESGANRAEIARLHSQAGDTRVQLVQLASARSERATTELRAAYSDLQTLLPQWRAAADQLARTRLRAPVAGQVMGLAFRAPGGVVAPGQPLAQVVPVDRALTVEAQVATTDANDLSPGQQARVRFSGLHGRTLPLADGVITRVSADSFTDERTGRGYYTAAVRVPAPELARVARAAGLRGSIKPGTPVQVEVVLKARTALSYWVDPLLQSMTGSMHER